MVSRYQPGDTERAGTLGMDANERSMPPTLTLCPHSSFPSADLNAFQDSCVALFVVLDTAKLFPSYAYPSELLRCLDTCRTLAAALPAGPIQDQQQQEALITTFLEGFLTLDELAGLLHLNIHDTRQLVSPRVFQHALDEVEKNLPQPEPAPQRICARCGGPLRWIPEESSYLCLLCGAATAPEEVEYATREEVRA